MRNNKGITLVALVVTIVVLLILAGVSINLVLGENGIVAKTKEAKDKTEQAQSNELQDFNNISGEIDEILSDNGSGNGGTGGGSGTDKKVPAEPTEETAPYYPDGDFKTIDGTIDSGLVIADKNGNEYVWVVVPKSLYNNTAYNSNDEKKPSSSTDYANIEYCLQQYTATYRNGTKYSDTYVADDKNVGWFADATAYNNLKNSMLKSVYENGGFYVGRYEAGISENRTASSGKATETPVSKANAYPYNYVTRTQAKVLAEKIKYTNGDKSYTGSLMFGVQWDLVLAFMHNKGKIDDSKLITNSTTIGNYEDNLWEIKNANAQYSEDYGDTFTACQNPFKKESSSDILLTTGADSSFSVQNIYDIAGNVYEWTLENTSNTRYPCASKGGWYGASGSRYGPAVYLNFKGTDDSGSCFGFRVSLF